VAWRLIGTDLVLWPASEDIQKPLGKYAWAFQIEL
jgi:hypothetical protein